MSKRLRDKEAWIVTAKREQAYEKEHPEHIEEKVAELKEIRKQKDVTRAEQAALKAYPTHKGASKEWIKLHLSGGDCAVFIKIYS